MQVINIHYSLTSWDVDTPRSLIIPSVFMRWKGRFWSHSWWLCLSTELLYQLLRWKAEQKEFRFRRKKDVEMLPFRGRCHVYLWTRLETQNFYIEGFDSSFLVGRLFSSWNGPPFQVAFFFLGGGGRATSQFGNFHIQNSWQHFSVRAWKLPTLSRDVFETHLIHGETISW